jgi:hypothetical protein
VAHRQSTVRPTPTTSKDSSLDKLHRLDLPRDASGDVLVRTISEMGQFPMFRLPDGNQAYSVSVTLQTTIGELMSKVQTVTELVAPREQISRGYPAQQIRTARLPLPI